MSNKTEHIGSWSSKSVGPLHSDHLRLVSGEPFVQHYKRHSHDLLQLTPGSRVLDIGCGLGDDATSLANTVAPNGRVVGIDSSDLMIKQAQQRHHTSPLPVEFHIADARVLPFADETFDAVRTDRTLQHIPMPGSVFTEIKRVLKPGGRVVCSETDWETLSLDVADRQIYRKIKSHIADQIICNGWMGRQLASFLIELQFQDVRPFAHTAVFTDYGFTKQWGVWHRAVQSARESGVITPEEATNHLKDVEERATKGQHLLSLTLMIVVATNP